MTQTVPTGATETGTTEQLAPELLTGPLETREGVPRAGAHVLGVFSVERFCDAGALYYTHEDAQGMYDWLNGHGHTPNFWFQDASVKIWAYEETYDNWMDTYGIDADLVTYHSGHGAMDANGVFYVPMGAAWAGNDCTARSDRMAVGNEYCRYLFWSTCLSLRVFDGHSPIRTWHPANKGLRMIFGFETVSWDDPNYGRNFGRHWNAGESLGTAWLNASWDIAHDQAPSVVACGANAAEAQDRVFNERFLQWATVSSNYYWWRWYDVARSAMRERNMLIPSNPTARLAPAGARSTRDLAERFNFDPASMRRVGSRIAASDGTRRLTVLEDGTIIVNLAQLNLANRVPMANNDAASAASEAIRRYGMDTDGQLMLDRVVPLNDAGMGTTGSGALEGPYRSGTMVQYRQAINDIPIITPSAGTVRVILDNEGVPTTIIANTRTVEDLSEQPFGAPAVEPTPDNGTQRAPEGSSPDRLLAKAFSDRLRSLAAKGDLPVGFAQVPGTREIGYDVQGDRAILVAQRAVELDFGDGFRKRYWIKAPIVG